MHNIFKPHNHDSWSIHTRLSFRSIGSDNDPHWSDRDLTDLQGLHPMDRSRNDPDIPVHSDMVRPPRMEGLPSWRNENASVPKRYNLFFTTRVPIGAANDRLLLVNGAMPPRPASVRALFFNLLDESI